MATIILTQAEGLTPSEPSRVVIRSEQIAGFVVNTATKTVYITFLSGEQMVLSCTDPTAVAAVIERAL